MRIKLGYSGLHAIEHLGPVDELPDSFEGLVVVDVDIKTDLLAQRILEGAEGRSRADMRDWRYGIVKVDIIAKNFMAEEDKERLAWAFPWED